MIRWPGVIGTGALCLLTGSAQAQGGPPLETDGPGTPGSRHWEMNLAITVERNSEGTVCKASLWRPF
jgi:hypothetical protein